MSALNPQQVRVAELVAAGCSVDQVMGATGFSGSYISQLKSVEEFQGEVARLSSRRLESNIVKRDDYDSLEVALLSGIKERASTADMSELTRALDVVAKNNPNKGKSAGGGDSGNAGIGVGIAVTLNLPAHILEPLSIDVNSRNEVMEMGGQSLLPLTVKGLQDRLGEDRM